MSKFIDLAGQTFGRLTVIKRVGNSIQKCARWECQCSCGVIVICTSGHLRSGHSTTCGCIRKEKIVLRNTSHNKSKTTEYRTWYHMIQRCNNPNDKDFKHYGGRGIKIFPEWRISFSSFFDYIGLRPTTNHTIERIDNNLGYFPGNVRWATKKEQGNNRRTNKLVTFNGKTMNITQWTKELGMSEHILYERLIILGWPIKKAFTEPIHQSHIPRSSPPLSVP